MAIAALPTVFKSFTFGGESSADYGVQILGEGVFNAPERAVELVSVPGRNGSIAIDQGYWENIEVTYPAVLIARNPEEFATAMANFRNMLCSKRGYCRLSDDYHPGEYRMAMFNNDIEVDEKVLRGGEFDITFNCKPQRWLTSGEVPVTIGEWGATKDASGEMVTIESEGGEAAKSLVVALEPIQAGSGDPSPDNVRPISGRTEVVTWDDPKYGGTIEWNQLFSTTGIAGTFNGVTITTTGTTVTFKGTATANVYRTLYNATSHNNHVYYVTLSGANSNNVWLYNDSKGVALFGNGFAVQRATADSQFYIRLASGGVYDETITAQIFDLTQMFGETKANEIYAMEQAHAGGGVAYFKSLFPKDYYDYNVGEETCVSAVNGDEYHKHTTALGRTVYGGTLDVVSGVLTVDMAMVDLGSLTWTAYGATASYDRYITAGIDSTAKEGTVGVCSHFQGSRTFAVGNIVIGSGGSKLSAFTTKGQYASASAFKTAMSGATFVYELATPQTYQLTPQQVTLLLGENHVWSDGAITMQYGDDPNSLWNPTQYDAGPIVSAEGYGVIRFNGYEIDLEDMSFGDILLHNVYQSHNATQKLTVPFDRGFYRAGNAIKIYGLKIRSTVSPVSGRSFSRVTMQYNADSPRTAPTLTSGVSSDGSAYFQMAWNIVSFDVDSTWTLEYITDQTIDVFGESLTLTDAGRKQTIIKTENSIILDLTNFFTKGFSRFFSGHTYEISFERIVGHSTGTLIDGADFRIDCELGEAFMIKNGVLSNLNGYVDLGSDLPKLKSGSNLIEADSTITKLVITPNWWKL